jgi:hypothetical protein
LLNNHLLGACAIEKGEDKGGIPGIIVYVMKAFSRFHSHSIVDFTVLMRPCYDVDEKRQAVTAFSISYMGFRW